VLSSGASLLLLGVYRMHLPDHYPPLLSDIAQILHLSLSQTLPADQAATLALAQTDLLSRTYSGCQVYFPKQDARQRDAAIAREFNGRNHADLARRHHLTVTQIYNILDRRRRIRQPALF